MGSRGANAGVFGALGWAAGAGFALSVVRCARQAVWIGVGFAILPATRAGRAVTGAPLRPAPSGGR